MTKQTHQAIAEIIGEIPTRVIEVSASTLIRQGFYRADERADLEQELALHGLDTHERYGHLPTAQREGCLVTSIRHRMHALRKLRDNDRKHLVFVGDRTSLPDVADPTPSLTGWALDGATLRRHFDDTDLLIIRLIAEGESVSIACKTAGRHHSYFTRQLRPRLQELFS